MAERRDYDKRERRPRKRPAKLLEGDTKLNYKNVELLTNFITERKKIAPRRMTGCTALQQRQGYALYMSSAPILYYRW